MTFVVNFARSTPNATDKFFRLFYSTKRLLQHAQNGKSFHTDGTYKIVIQGFPLIVFGISDLENHFHLTGLGLCSSEGAADYQFVLYSVMHGVIKTTNEEIKPNAIVADSAPAITKAIRDAFDDDDNIVRIHCYAHVMMNVEKQKFQKSDHKVEFKDDVRKLQQSYDVATFVQGCKLLEKKWAKKEAEVMKWFRASYIDMNNTWYSGALARTPKTNNVTESFNKQLKQFQTFYKRSGVNKFMHDALNIVKQRSKEYILDKKAPILSIDYASNKQLMKTTMEYSKLNKSYVSEKTSNGAKFYVYGGSNTNKITIDQVNKWMKRKCTTFVEFKNTLHDVHQIHFTGTQMDVNTAVCTCPEYATKYCCKHVALIGIRTGLLLPPDDLIQEPIVAKNPRGRPRKATKALIKD